MNEHGYHEEVPLPTYEEVVGASNHNIGFKGDVLLRPKPSNAGSQADSELIRECMGVPAGEDGSSSLRCFVRWKNWVKKYLAALVGVIITPLFFLFIILQLKSCGTCKHFKEDIRSDLKRLDECNAEMTDISGRYNELYKDLQNVKKERDGLLLIKETADTEMKNLRFQYNTATSNIIALREHVTRLKKEIEEYKILLKNQRNDLDRRNENTASPKTTTKRTTATTAETTTEGSKDLLFPFDPNDDTIGNLMKIINYLNRQLGKPTTSLIVT